MTWTLTRGALPQDGRRVRLHHAGEVAWATWTGSCWQLQVESTTMRDLALHHGWTLQAASAPVGAAAPPAPPAPPDGAQAAPSGPVAAPAWPSAADVAALVACTVDELVAALDDHRWHSHAALDAVLDAEASGARRKGVRAAVARVRRQLGAG